jgi:hypothetical protein
LFTLSGFTLLANVCLEMFQNGQFQDKPEWNIFCLRAMTGAIVIVDHIDEIGAFNKQSKVRGE